MLVRVARLLSPVGVANSFAVQFFDFDWVLLPTLLISLKTFWDCFNFWSVEFKQDAHNTILTHFLQLAQKLSASRPKATLQPGIEPGSRT